MRKDTEAPAVRKRWGGVAGLWGFRREPNVVSNVISIGFLLKILY